MTKHPNLFFVYKWLNTTVEKIIELILIRAEYLICPKRRKHVVPVFVMAYTRNDKLLI